MAAVILKHRHDVRASGFSRPDMDLEQPIIEGTCECARVRMLARVRSTTDALCHTVTHTVAERMPPREACILDAHLQRKTSG
jgi:hypothetical protein